MAYKSITFTKVRLENDWLSNMAPYGIKSDDLDCRTAEAFFQALRFPKGSSERRRVSMETNPMSAKKLAKSMQPEMNVVQLSLTDVLIMRYTIGLKLIQNPELYDKLQQLDEDQYIMEDVTNRGLSTSRSDLFWGSAKVGLNEYSESHWVGVNTLGNIWDDYRDMLSEVDYARGGVEHTVSQLKVVLTGLGVI